MCGVGLIEDKFNDIFEIMESQVIVDVSFCVEVPSTVESVVWYRLGV